MFQMSLRVGEHLQSAPAYRNALARVGYFVTEVAGQIFDQPGSISLKRGYQLELVGLTVWEAGFFKVSRRKFYTHIKEMGLQLFPDDVALAAAAQLRLDFQNQLKNTTVFLGMNPVFNPGLQFSKQYDMCLSHHEKDGLWIHANAASDRDILNFEDQFFFVAAVHPFILPS